MAEVFAGFVVGYALALALSPIAAIALVRSNDRTGFAQRIAPEGTNVVALSVVLHFAAMIVLTAVGLILGMALGGLEDRRPDGGLGSPNLVYTLLVVALTAVIVIPTIAVPAIRRIAFVGALIFVVAFGWAVPWLAQLGS
ncbi:MAG TPA: hypothetical protein VFH62_02650 [Dehalococcoidia bacterium]|jgi:hypothetical protein|nr:hypothetical protein [Dehalococcoidia bacterium]